MPLIRYQLPEDDQVPNVQFEEDAESAWAAVGIPRVAQALAVAAAVVALAIPVQALAHGLEEDIVPQPTPISVDEDAVPKFFPRSLLWMASAHTPPPPPALVAEEDALYPQPPWPFRYVLTVLAVGDGADTSLSYQDEDFWQNPVPPVPAQNYVFNALWWGQTEDHAPLRIVPDDEGVWQNPAAPLLANNIVPSPTWPQDEAVAVTWSEEDFWQPPVLAPQTQVPLPVWVSGNEDAAQLTILPIQDEDFFQAPVLAPQTQVPVPVWVLGNEEFPTLFVPPLPGDEDPYIPPVPAPPRGLLITRDCRWMFDYREFLGIGIGPIPPTITTLDRRPILTIVRKTYPPL